MEFFEILEMVLRLLFGLQMTFWGLNGFFNWIAIPPSSPVIDKFVQSCIETQFIMPTVKFIEVVAGSLLILGFCVPSCLLLFAPIVFIVGGLHLRHNPKPWSVILPICVPFVLLILIHSSDFRTFFQ